MATLFKDVYLLDGGREHAKRGHLLISKGRIAGIYDLSDTPPAADKIISGHGHMAVLPGFVNAHTHAAMTLLRGLGEEAPLMTWLKEKIWPVEDKLTGDFIYWGTQSAILEMLATGTTCFADMYMEMERVAEAAFNARIRAALCRGIVGGEAGKLEKSLAENLALAEHWHGREGLITVQIGPHAPYTVKLDDFVKLVSAAKEHGLGVHTHFLETKWELDYLRDELKKTPAEFLKFTGLLDLPCALAHSVWFNPDEADGLDLSRATLVHNAKSNLKLGSGVMALNKWLDKGVAVALGTDGASSNNRLDMWDEMRAAALLHKGVNLDATCVSAVEALRMASYDGARAFGFAKKGMLQDGWLADLILVDLDRPHYIGFDEENLAAFIVYAGSSADITGTMVNGKWLYKSGEFPTLDREEIMAKAREARAAITR